MTEPRRVVIVALSGRPDARRDRAGGGVPHGGRARAGRATRSRSSPRDPGPLRSTSVGLVADRAFRTCRGPIDTLIVAGRPGIARRRPATAPRSRGSRAAAAGRAACAPSARARSCWQRPGCSTATAPPPTGRAATAWRERYPDVTVERDPIFVRDGNVYTSAGVTAGMDLALALVEEDLGRADRARGRALAGAVREAAGRAVAVQRPARRPDRRRASRCATCRSGSPATSTATSPCRRWPSART